MAKTQNAASQQSEEIYGGLQEKIQAKLQAINQIKKSAPPSKSKPKAIKPTPTKAVTPQDGVARGKKRDNQGAVLDRKSSKTITEPKPASKEVQNLKKFDEELQNEVFALGGTVEDMELFEGVESDSELEGVEPQTSVGKGKNAKSPGLEKGITNILKEISLVQGEDSTSSDSVSAEGSESEDEPVGTKISIPASEPAAKTLKLKLGRNGVSRLKCEPRPDWFNTAQPEVDLSKQPKYTLSQYSLSQLHDYAKALLETENELYKKTHQSASSHGFYNTVISSGTLSDRISALTLAVQESPLHNVKALESLIGLAKKRSRGQAVDVLRALKDLFAQGSLLPGDRRLYLFSAQPTLLPCFGKVKAWNTGDALPSGVDEAHLIMWAFESWVKEQFFEVLKTLEIWCNDEIEFSKSRAIRYVFELLKEKPEQESNLLRLLVNKLGDPVKKISSQTSYLLMQLLSTHPAMKGVVVSALETDFIFRPGQSLHGKYYATVTLNQTTLSVEEQEVAVKLLDIYFGLFVNLLKSTDEREEEKQDDKIEDKADEKRDENFLEGLSRGQQRRRKRKMQRANGPVNVDKEDELRQKLISAILTGVNRAYPYANKEGQDLSSHLETLFKITHSSNFNTSIQAMMLIQQMCSSHQGSADRFYRTLYESLLDPRLINTSKPQLYLNLLHRSLKSDLNLKRVKAFVKRILQILTLAEPSFICGAFFLLNDLQTTFPGLKALLDQPEDFDQDEVEVFRDFGEEDGPTNRSLVHPDRRNETTNPTNPNAYDPRKRDPVHSKAENSCAWDLLPFLAHYHPSVTIGADHLLRKSKLPGKPDLALHTLSHFLERFVYRNPKEGNTPLRGSSMMQPMANDDRHAVLISRTTDRKRSLPVNSEQFRAQNENQVAPEHVFFHRYFALSKEPMKKKSKKAHAEDRDEAGSVGDEEDEVWKAMMDSAPHLEGEEDSDGDLDMSDLESAFDEEVDGESGSDMGESGSEESSMVGRTLDAFDNEILDVDDGSGEEPESDGGSEARALPLTQIQKSKGKEVVGEKAGLTSRERKRKMKALPMFASASDYAAMLDNDSDEDVG